MSTKEETQMKMEHGEDSLQKLAKLIGDALGADTAEIIRIPEGKSIADVIRERGLIPDPEGQICEECGITHDYIKAPKERTVDPSMSVKQLRAVASLNKRIDQIEKGLSLLKALRDSTATPEAERKQFQTIEDIGLAFELKMLGLL